VRRAATISCLALAVALAALAPSAATAAGRTTIATRGFTPQLWLQAAHGYRLGVSAHHGAVTLTVSHENGGRGGTATTYVARGTATPNLLRASFGRFGRISMRFRPAAAKARLAPHGRCHGPGTLLVRRGVFVGRLRFRGEGGYLSVSAHRAKGRIFRLAHRCFHLPTRRGRRLIRSSQGGRSDREITYLAAQWKGATASETFLALKLKRKVAFIAQTSGDAGRVSLFHVAFSLDRPRAFSLNGAFTSGHVTPGGPFTGAGTYSAAPDGTRSWDGPLAVNFPGSPRFRLTGPPLEPSVGTIPALFALFLLKSAKSGNALALAAAEKPSLLGALGP
jgi:hypothetical protein